MPLNLKDEDIQWDAPSKGISLDLKDEEIQWDVTPAPAAIEPPPFSPYVPGENVNLYAGLGALKETGATLGRAALNLPVSVGRQAVGLASAVLHPVETIKGVLNVAGGATGAAIGGQEGSVGTPEQQAAYEGMKAHFVNRYGSAEGFKNAIETDPAGVLMEIGTAISGVGSGVGAVGTGAKTLGGLTGAEGLSAAGTAAEAIGTAAKTAGGKIALAPVTVPYAVGKGVIKAGKEVIPAAARAGAEAIAEKLTPDSTLEKIVETGMSKGIKPSVTSVGKTAPQRAAYFNKAQEAIKEIINNKNNLSLKNAEGDIHAGLPESVNHFAQAIDQSKRSLFSEYDALAQAAGRGGAAIDLTPVVNELKTITNNKVINDLSPEIIKYAKTRADSFTARGSYSAIEAQDAITRLNSSLDAFYKNPSYDTAGKATVDALVANKLRNSLDNVIESTTEGGYQALKNKYGALKTIEKDVNRRATLEANKNVKGLVDFTDVLSGAEAVKGLLTLSPSAMTSAATIKGITKWYKWRNSPDAITRAMFRNAERNLGKTAIPSISSSPPSTSPPPTGGGAPPTIPPSMPPTPPPPTGGGVPPSPIPIRQGIGAPSTPPPVRQMAGQPLSAYAPPLEPPYAPQGIGAPVRKVRQMQSMPVALPSAEIMPPSPTEQYIAGGGRPLRLPAPQPVVRQPSALQAGELPTAVPQGEGIGAPIRKEIAPGIKAKPEIKTYRMTREEIEAIKPIGYGYKPEPVPIPIPFDYTKDMTPIKALKVKINLDKNVMNDGRVTSRKELVEAKVGDSATIVIGKEGRRLQTPDGLFLSEKDISKTAMDYAAYLIKNKTVGVKEIAPGIKKKRNGQ